MPVSPAETEDFILTVDPHPGMTALDIACGTGQWTRQMADLGLAVTGCDFSDEALRRAKAAPSRVNMSYELWDVVAEPIPRALAPGRFDVVTCRYSLPYLEPARLLTDVGRWLKPDGVFYALAYIWADTNAPSPPTWQVHARRGPCPGAFHAGFTSRQLSAIGAGWVRREVHQVGRHQQTIVLSGYGRAPHAGLESHDTTAAGLPAACRALMSTATSTLMDHSQASHAHWPISPQESQVTTPSTTSPAFTESDALQLNRVITELLSVCASLATHHAPNGTWAPAASGTAALSEASVVIETLSRSLNQTRRDLRKLSKRARRSARSTSPPFLLEPRNAATSRTAPEEGTQATPRTPGASPNALSSWPPPGTVPLGGRPPAAPAREDG
ncbi:class I SAM-dependent methyltransferase [Streptomyces sp. NPDC002779]|uniref:class I SAM-dependent methyltransferase n=1 Tax=Streptomyces sp. NPDC002779 TaxID=3364664 RepID=UPI0036926ECF